MGVLRIKTTIYSPGFLLFSDAHIFFRWSHMGSWPFVLSISETFLFPSPPPLHLFPKAPVGSWKWWFFETVFCQCSYWHFFIHPHGVREEKLASRINFHRSHSAFALSYAFHGRHRRCNQKCLKRFEYWGSLDYLFVFFLDLFYS